MNVKLFCLPEESLSGHQTNHSKVFFSVIKIVRLLHTISVLMKLDW